MNETLKTLYTRRSIREFTNKQISDEDLALILHAAAYAPSGRNQQTWNFTVVQNPNLLKELADDIKLELNMKRDFQYNFHGAPTLILISSDRNSKTGNLDCAAALENILIAATSLNIGSCWINQLNNVCDTPKIRTLLNSFQIPEEHIVWGCAALGYSTKTPKAPPRKKGIIKIIK